MTDPALHGHLWRLPDGTGLHAPAGELTVDEETGRLCCHLCGRWWNALGAHVRVHGHSAATYRAAMGLCVSEPLTATVVSAAISERQARAYRSNEQMRERLAAMDPLRRSGELSAMARRALAGPDSIQRRARRQEALRAGRDTLAANRERAVRARLDAAGYDTLPAYLRDLYAAGCSLEDLTRRTGLGRGRLRSELDAAGIAVRASGQNTTSGRRSRAEAADRTAARRVGADDIHRWLRERRAAEWTLARLAEAVDHSIPWVRQRLTVETTPGIENIS